MSDNNISYKTKYLKYKIKYLNIKNQLAGSGLNFKPRRRLEPIDTTTLSPEKPEVEDENELPPPPLKLKKLKRQVANVGDVLSPPPPPLNPKKLQRQVANAGDAYRPRVFPIDDTDLINQIYSDKYTFILSGGEIFNDMERKDLENQDILFTNKDKSFLIHSNNLTLYNGKIFLVKMNEETKTVYLTENKTRKP